uniref:Transcription initiation factor TFIID subunit 8 n=1 Tax=Ascaris lumbricoides TaxID=6252 RepID=A0A0M3IJB9_ASCLU
MSAIPHDALVVQNVLKEMGVTDYEPRVVSQLLEFAYRYVNILFITSAWRGARPDRQFMLELAEQKNSIPLPAIRQNFGMRLPNDRFCLVQPNMQWKSRERLRELAEQMSRNQKEEAERSTETPRQTRPEAITSVLKRRPIDEEDYDT